MTAVDEWIPLVTAKLKVIMDDETAPMSGEFDETNPPVNVTRFAALLKETGAVIAGGFVLQAIAGYKYSVDRVDRLLMKRDMDIYVPGKNMKHFLEEMVKITKLNFRSFIVTDSTIYCRSFLRKNGIRRIYRFYGGGDLNVDVMALRNSRTPTQVCSTFDLTCCQVWFDGTSVFATHPDHIREKKAWLQGDYIPLFIKGNSFLKIRIAKYQKRGFTITYDPSFAVNETIQPQELVNKQQICPSDEKDEAFMQRWFKRVSLRWLISQKKDEINSAPINAERYETGSFTLGIANNSKRWLRKNIEMFKVEEDEGHDSEEIDDIDDTQLSRIAFFKGFAIIPMLKVLEIPNEKWKDLGPSPLNPVKRLHLDFIKSRCLFALLYRAVNVSQGYPTTLGSLIEMTKKKY